MSYLGRRGASAALTSADIPDNSITSAKIGVDVIVAEDIANNAVTVAELADNAVTQAKLADDAVGTDELANDVVINTSGAITTTGAFTSVGIDDNASGAVAITIDASENIVFGNTTGEHTVGILAGTSNACKLQMGDSGSGTQCQLVYNNSNDSLGFRVNGSASDAIHIKSDGNVGIGTTTPDLTLDVSGSAEYMAIIQSSNADATVLKLDNTGSGGRQWGFISGATNYGGGGVGFYIRDFDAGANRLKIDSSGNVGIGTSTTVWPLTVYTGNGEVFKFYRAGSTASHHLGRWHSNNGSTDLENASIRNDGTFYSRSNSYTNYSDERIKESITDVDSQWDKIKALRFINYNYKSSEGQEMPTYMGLVAQEVELISPGCISENDPEPEDIRNSSEFGTLYEEGDVLPEGKKVGDVKTILDKVKAVKTSIIYMKSVKALQEAMAKIETLEAKVTALENA